MPLLQRLVVGADVILPLLDEPQAPLTTASTGAVQDVLVPPCVPAQVQFQGPEPLTVDALPRLQRPLVGFELVGTLFAGPHIPSSVG